MVITIIPSPTVNVGLDAFACDNGNYQIVNFAATNYSTISWTSSGTGVFSNPNTALPTYIPSAADLNAGSVTLTATVQGESACNLPTDLATDSFVLNFIEAPTVDAGNEETICSGSNIQITTASSTNATSYLWTSNGTGTSQLRTL